MSFLAIVLFVSISLVLVLSLRRRWSDRSFIWEVWRQFRPLLLLEAVAVLTMTVVVASVLLDLGAPFTWGWFVLLTGHHGNFTIQPILDVGQSGHAFLWLASIGVLAVLLLLMPHYARDEELKFRKGRETWRQILPMSLMFGLWHLWVGVPLAIGIALALPGLWFGWRYRRAFLQSMREDEPVSALDIAREMGVQRSTVCHALYNSVIMVMAFIMLMREMP